MDDSEIEKKVLEFKKSLDFSNRQSRFKIFKFAEKHGLHIINSNFYSPIPFVGRLNEEFFRAKYFNLDWNEENQIKFVNELGEYSAEFLKLIEGGKIELNFPSFPYYDSFFYYSIIRKFNPNKIVEVGGGNSTKIANLALNKNNNFDSLTVIDPYISSEFKKEFDKTVNLIEKPVQEIPIEFFEQLSSNDVLFYDGTHVSKIGSDVNFIFLEVMPKLKPGVLIHIHDIFLPGEYPRHHRKKLHFWNEQYLLHAFLIGNRDFEILLGVHFMKERHQEILKKIHYLGDNLKGASFWIRKKLI